VSGPHAMPQIPQVPPQRRRLRAEWLALGLMLLLLGVAIGYLLYSERQNATAREVDRLQAQARVIDDILIRQLQGVNNSLEGARDEFLRSEPGHVDASLSIRLKVLSSAMPGVRGMVILDRDGTVVASTADVLLGKNFQGQREYFDGPRRRPDSAVLYVSAPFKAAPAGTLVLSVGRVLARPGGEFAGVVVATLDPEYFNVVLRSVIYAADMSVVVMHGAGRVFLTTPPNPLLLGRDVTNPGSIFSLHRGRGQVSSVFVGPVPVSGQERIVVSRSITRAELHMDHPIVAAVGRELSAVYIPWRKQALEYSAFYAVCAAAAGFSLYIGQRRRKAFDDLAAAAASEQQRNEIERAARQAELEASLHEKEVLLKEIHHRVKNNLQVISSLLQLQAGYVEDDAARRVFEESQGRIKSMALVHEKLYQSKDLAGIDFGDYVRDLVSGLTSSYGAHAQGVVIEVEAASLHLDVDRAIPCGLIVNELVTNAFKHAFPNGRAGRIDVTLSGGGSSAIQLSVRDDGVGWPADFDPAQSSSLGLRLVHILAKQLQGRLELHSADGICSTLTLAPEEQPVHAVSTQ